MGKQKLKNKIIVAILTLTLLFTATSSFAETEGINVLLDGETLEFDVKPIIIEGRTLVPFRKIFEELGCAVSYMEEDELKIVSARQGTNLVMLQIGDKNMIAGGNEETLEVAPIIVDGRTLVPLRAVSEALECEVKWNGENREVSIFKKKGQFEIESERISKEVKNADGIILMNITATYPVIKIDSAFCAEINKTYKENAEKFVVEKEKEWLEDAKEIYNNMGKELYRAMEFSSTYEVKLNRNNMISILFEEYKNTMSSYPNIFRYANTFDMKKENVLLLEEILGKSKEEAYKQVYDYFAELLNYVGELQELEETLKQEIYNVSYYLTDNSLFIYFNTYQIGPHALGSPMVKIDFNGENDILKIDLSGANLEELEFELEGNPSTGYSWEVAKIDEEKIKIESEYLSSNTDLMLVGAGGNYKFAVSGVSQGNCELKLEYKRPWEKEAIKTIVYRLYVEKDKTITVIDREEMN